MILYQCTLTLHDNVFFATREMGTLFETEKYLHNWALSYALFEGQHINRPYRLKGEYAQKSTTMASPSSLETRVPIAITPSTLVEPKNWQWAASIKPMLWQKMPPRYRNGCRQKNQRTDEPGFG